MVLKSGKWEACVWGRFSVGRENHSGGMSLVAQWLRLHLPKRGMRVWYLVGEDPTCFAAPNPKHRGRSSVVTNSIKILNFENE